MSEREPELGLGVVASIDRARIGIRFPATGEQRLYALGTPVLKRVQFRAGETVQGRGGKPFVIEAVAEDEGLLVYVGAGQRVREDEISDVTSVNSPQERLLAAQTDPSEVFDLRYRALQMQNQIRQSDVRGFLGGRLELIPHQFYILQEVSQRQIPRVLLADEVGLGKTIEACLILQRLLAVGRARRILILVPESLVHQWFVELLRRFTLWFSIFDEERCLSTERGDPNGNPFLAAQLGLCATAWLAGDERRREQALAAGWDMVVVDEAHHLAWTPDAPSREYSLVEQLAQKTPGLLLLTATPTQLGLEGHFARLRLLDPARYSDLERFRQESKRYAEVAAVAAALASDKPLKTKERTVLARILQDDETREQRLTALDRGEAGARRDLLQRLIDRHGTGRVMFRNTRAAMKGFPKRQFCPAWLEDENPTLRARIARELEAEETGADEAIRYSFRDDPRITWLADFLRTHREEKVLLICRSQRKVAAISAALQEQIAAKVALFHEGLALVQRDRNAAWFSEPEGAQLLICSEIGSEGRNFQFAHDLVLFDLPLNPGLVEQRIGRLDRIGQRKTIRIHVPCVKGSAEALVLDWYDRGLGAFAEPLQSGNEYVDQFRERLLSLARRFGEGRVPEAEVEQLIQDTIASKAAITETLRKGRDRLLELRSHQPELAARVIDRIREVDADPALRTFLLDLLDHFGVRVKEHEDGELFLDPSHAYIESFPSLPPDGLLASFQRERAVSREDMGFLTADHPVVRDAIDLLLNSPAGTAAFARLQDDEPNLLVEALYVLEAVADSRWHVDQFLSPTPLRVLVDVRGNDRTRDQPPARFAADLEDAPIQPFLERPGFNAQLMKEMLESATERAEEQAEQIKTDAKARATEALGGELQRLRELARVNDHVRADEIALAQEQLNHVIGAISEARLRLDAVRLVLQSPSEY